MKELFAVVLSLAALSFQQSPPTQPTDPTSWPIPGVLRPGQGVTSPVLLHETKPNYSPDAMRARIQGLVVMECVVELDGTVGAVRVTRSLDQAFGLDNEAVRTVKQWRFRPGTKDGAPVRVVVMVEMSFTLGDRANVSAPNPAVNPGTTAPIAWPDATSGAQAWTSEPSCSGSRFSLDEGGRSYAEANGMRETSGVRREFSAPVGPPLGIACGRLQASRVPDGAAAAAPPVTVHCDRLAGGRQVLRAAIRTA